MKPRAYSVPKVPHSAPPKGDQHASDVRFNCQRVAFWKLHQQVNAELHASVQRGLLLVGQVWFVQFSVHRVFLFYRSEGWPLSFDVGRHKLMVLAKPVSSVAEYKQPAISFA
jgi:hypothetical protein